MVRRSWWWLGISIQFWFLYAKRSRSILAAWKRQRTADKYFNWFIFCSELRSYLLKDDEESIQESYDKIEEPSVRDKSKLNTIQHNGETYVSSFDFFQRFQRWMYEQGLFNFYGFWVPNWQFFENQSKIPHLYICKSTNGQINLRARKAPYVTWLTKFISMKTGAVQN